MLKAIVETEGLQMAESLLQCLCDHRVDVAATTAAGGQRGLVYVAPARLERERGGQAGLLEAARRFGARSVVVVDEAAERFGIRSDLGGSLLRVDLPPEAAAGQGWFLVASLLHGKGFAPLVEPRSRELFALAERVARSDVSVFVNGPTGSGKEVLAKFIHAHSPRRDNAFIAINCAAIPENMLEAMLFGHEKGAFTGASAANVGLIRAADGGSLLLDEVSEMPLALQAKLLRALQERAVTPVGASRQVEVDIRIIATSNRDMARECREGRFREDLYYRLNVFPLVSMPLAARRQDIVPIALELLVRGHRDLAALPWLDASAVERLMAHDWPGNVRELDNVMQRAAVLCSDGRITAEHIMLDHGMRMDLAAPAAGSQLRVAAGA